MRSTTFAGLLAGLALAGHAASAQDTAPEAEAPAAETPATAAPAAEAPGTAAPEAEAQAPAGTAAAPADAAETEYDAATVVASVDGTDITLGHVVALRARLPEQYQGLPDETLMQGLIDQLVDQQLLSRTLSEDPESDPLAVRLHIDNERRAALAQRAVQDRVEEPVDDAAVQEAYDTLAENFQPQTEYNASHIIVPSEEEAAALKTEIDGGGDFAELAQEHSQDGSAAQGGSLGWFGPGRMVPEFETAVAEMAPGEVAGPIETQFGWHLITLNETRETEPPALETIREQLAEQVRQQRLNEAVEALRAEAEIERPETGIPPQAVRDDTILRN